MRKNSRALDLGCGTGNDAIYLAKTGFKVIGVDLASSAIQMAEEKAKQEKVDSRCQFYNADVLDLSFLGDSKFDLVLDRTCFGGFEGGQRRKYKENVRRVLARKRRFLLIEISDADGSVDSGKVSERDLRDTFEADFKIISLKPVTLKHRDHEHRAWKMLALVCDVGED